MRAPLLESPPQPCRPVWAGRHGTADGEEKRGGFHQPSAQAAISREVPLIRETLAMQRSTRSDACSSEADKRGLEIRAGPAMQSYAICQLPAARLPRARTKPRAHRIDCACGKRCASTEWERTGEERPARGGPVVLYNVWRWSGAPNHREGALDRHTVGAGQPAFLEPSASLSALIRLRHREFLPGQPHKGRRGPGSWSRSIHHTQIPSWPLRHLLAASTPSRAAACGRPNEP